MGGPFCAQCGQAAVDYRRSFRHIIVDVLDSFLNWDSKFFATIGWLIARPWHLTNQFLAGRRVRYVHPLRLYLLVSILFFFVVNYWAKSIHADPSKLSAEDRAEIAADPDIPPGVKAQVPGGDRPYSAGWPRISNSSFCRVSSSWAVFASMTRRRKGSVFEGRTFAHQSG